MAQVRHEEAANGWLTGSRDAPGRAGGGLRECCMSWVPWTRQPIPR